MRIGFIGNFHPPFSTENDRVWSFRKLGHEVVTFQENETNPQDLLIAAKDLDLLFYSHTHGWEIPSLKEIFLKLKEWGIPTASVHLDKWAGLERVRDMGKEATWFTEYIFMADASQEACTEYNKLQLSWSFIKPGVVERDCYIAPPDRDKYPHDIVFVGSKGYHPEYPFRAQLVEFLHKTYGDRFGHYGNDGIRVVRGHDLNVLYSTAKICVGDSCFAGSDRYVSDRYYETRGRGGFLLHPQIEGIDRIGVGHYHAGNLSSLKEAIDYYLANDQKRENMRFLGHEKVKTSETYTHRAQEMIDIIRGKSND